MRSVTTTARATAARTKLAGLGVAAAALLAGCQEMPEYRFAAQPTGSFDSPVYQPSPPEAQFTVAFVPGSPQLRDGEAALLRNRIRTLAVAPGDDIVITYGITGSSTLDRSRVAVVRDAVGPTPARVRVLAGELGADVLANAALVQVQRFGRLTVVCPGTALNTWELDYNSPLPSLGCSNAVNRATQASVPRDLLEPRRMRGSEGVTSAEAVKRHREDNVKFIPLNGNMTGN
jgi:type IV pilus biogenesis protein CpaD/CtpE